MNLNKKNRSELKEFFKTNDRPVEEQFAAPIDAQLNQAEDGIAKAVGMPLSLEAEGDHGTREVLRFLGDFSQANPDWALNLAPRLSPDIPESGGPGFNISNASGENGLFNRSSNGFVGIGALQPAVVVHGETYATQADKSLQLSESSLLFRGVNAGEQVCSARTEVKSEKLRENDKFRCRQLLPIR